jgi:hypothetical protein
VSALRDDRVTDAISKMFEVKLSAVLSTVDALKKENKQLSGKLLNVRKDLNEAKKTIVALEACNRLDNLFIAGLPTVNFAEAVTAEATTAGSWGNPESSATTELPVLDLFNNRLNLQISAQDISVTHRLHKTSDGKPPAVIVKFTSRKARNKDYAARRQLMPPRRPSREERGIRNATNHSKIYINEDLTKEAAAVFREARDMVKRKKIFSAWTSGGLVHVRHFADSDCKPIKILNVANLSSFK